MTTRATLALALAGLSLACGAPPEGLRQIVIVSIDTLRADALGSYGNELGASPNLDAIAREGVRAADCVAPELGMPGCDYVLIGRRATIDYPFDRLVADMRRAFGQLAAKLQPRTVEGGQR